MVRNSMRNSDLSGKVVVITGASSGFGKGAARRFAERGASLVLAARREHLLEELARECESLGVSALAYPTDVSRRVEVEALADAAVSAFNRIDVWVNDAGVGVIGRFEETPLEDHEQAIRIDLLGVIYGSYFALRQFRAQGEGTLINVASALGKIPAPYYASYSAAKHGVVGLSGALRQELRENGLRDIHVCTVIPMATDTPFFEHASNYTGHETVPIPPLHDPEQVISAIVRLATHPEAEAVVGGAGKLSAAAHAIAPGVTERMMARNTHKAQIEQAAPGPETRGAVFVPTSSGTGVTGGWRRRG